MKTIFLTTMILLAFVCGGAMAAQPDPTNLTNDTDAMWVRWDWDAGAGNITDSYNVSRTVEGSTTWFNGTTNDYVHWSGIGAVTVTIHVYAYNTTYSELSGGITDTVTIPMMFASIVNLIDAIVPLFGSILDLIIAVFPLVIAMAFLAGLALLINKIFDKAMNFGGKRK